MKGAIGNALIMNLVISFIVIFYMLLIGSMAYSKAVKVKNYLMNAVISYDEEFRGKSTNVIDRQRIISKIHSLDDKVNDKLSKFGYIIADGEHCPYKQKGSLEVYPKNESYQLIKNTDQGSYDYCVYLNYSSDVNIPTYRAKYNYMVIVYMKFDFPVVGNFIKIPLVGETKSIYLFE